MKTEGCETPGAPAGAPPAHVIRRDAQFRRVALGASAGAAVACVALFVLHLLGHLPLGRPGTTLWCSWLLALASTAFRTSYLRVPAEQLADDWADRYALGAAASLPLGDPALDPLLARQRALSPFARPGAWSLLAIAGGLCWGAAATLTAVDAAGRIHPLPMDLMFGLLLLLSGGVHFTCAAVAAPSIYGQRAIRQAAALAHQRLRALQSDPRTGPEPGAGLHLVETPNGRRAAQ